MRVLPWARAWGFPVLAGCYNGPWERCRSDSRDSCRLMRVELEVCVMSSFAQYLCLLFIVLIS